MEPLKALVLDKKGEVAGQLVDATFISLEVDRTTSFSELRKAAQKRTPDLFLLHETPKLGGARLLSELQKLPGSAPAIVLAQAASSIWQATIANKKVEVLCDPVNQRELEYRIAKLVGQSTPALRQAYKTRATVTAVPELRNDKSGRLDAKLIANALGISLSDLCRSIGKKLQTVHHTPDGSALQKSLFSFERIVSTLLKLTGSRKGLKVWLNTPNNAFPKELPIDVLRQGNAELLADMLEDVLVGQPG